MHDAIQGWTATLDVKASIVVAVDLRDPLTPDESHAEGANYEWIHEGLALFEPIITLAGFQIEEHTQSDDRMFAQYLLRAVARRASRAG